MNTTPEVSSDERLNELLQTISENDIDSFHDLLNSSLGDISVENPGLHQTWINRLLLAAACGGNLKIVEALLELKADCNYFDAFGKSALFYAVEKHHFDVIKILLETGQVDLSRNVNGWTVLLWACIHGRIESVLLLLGHGDCDCNGKDSSGWTALHWACFIGDVDKVRALLGHGASWQREDSLSMTPRQRAEYMIWKKPENVRKTYEDVLRVIDKFVVERKLTDLCRIVVHKMMNYEDISRLHLPRYYLRYLHVR